MDLAELKFVVDTKQLEEAAKQIDALGTAVNKLNKPMQQLSTNSEKAADASAKVAKATAAKVKADEKAVESTSKLDSLLEKLNNRYIDMSKGSTSAEAGVLQLARSLGATTESALKPYKDILENIRELSKSPFDSAIGSVRSITQEYDSLTYRAELASKGIFLTTTQLKEYSRIANEIKGKLKAVDLDPTQGEGLAKFNTELKAQQDIYLGLANKVNTLKAAEKDRNDILNQQLKEQAKLQEASDNLFKFNQMRQQQEQQGYDKTMAAMRKYYSDMEKQSKTSRVNSGGEMDSATEQFYKNQAKAQKDAAKAAAYVADVELRLAAALSETNKALDKQSTDALVKYEKALRQTGLSSDEAAAKLANVKKQFEGVADKKQADRLQYLARAISVQMGDVGISLASGMNPLLVMIQQGDQIRGAIQQAGASGKELEKAMAGAATQIATSFLQTGQAIGGFFVNAVKSAGKVIFGLPIAVGTSAFAALAGNVEASAKAFDNLKVASMAAGKVGLLFIITSLVAVGKAMYDSVMIERDLSKALATTGSSMQMNRKEAIYYAQSLDSSGKSATEYTEVILAMAKAGFKAGDNFKLIADSAVNMQKYAGKPIAETVKAFEDLADKPAEGIAKLAKESRNVSADIIKLVNDLVRQGKMTEAAALATKEMAKVNSDAVKQIAADAGYLEQIWMTVIDNIAKYWKKFKDLVLGWGTEDPLQAQLAAKQKDLETFNKGDARRDPAIKKQLEDQISNLQEQIRLQNKIKTIKAENASRAEGEVEWQKLINTNVTDEVKVRKELERIKEVGLKAGKSAAEIQKLQNDYLSKQPKGTAVTVAASKDLSIIQKDYAEQLKLAEGFAKDERSILKARFDAGLIDRAEFVTQDTQLLARAEQKQLDVVDTFSAKYRTAYEAQANLLSQAFGKAKDPENRAKLAGDIQNLVKDFLEFNATVEDTKNKLGSAFNAREQVAMLDFEKAALASTKTFKEYAKTQEDIATNRKIDAELQDRLTNAYGAEAAQIKAVADETKRQTAEISKFVKAQKEAYDLYQATLNNPNASGSERASAYRAYITAMDNANAAISISRVSIENAGTDAVVAYYKQEYERISNGVTDSIVTALFEGGKAGSKKLRDLIVAELKKPITIVVKAVVDATLGSFVQGALGGASSSAGSSIFGSAIGNAAASYGASIFASNAAYGAAIGTTNIAAGSQAAMLASQTGSFGAQGAYATAQAAGTTASASELAMTAGPYVLAAVAALNALGVFRSTKTVGGGITGTLGAGNLEAYNLTRTSGTLFNGPSYGASSQGATEATIALDKAFIAMRDAITSTVDSLGFSTDKIKTFTMAVGDIKVHPDIEQLGLVLDGLSDQDKIAKINEVLTKSGNAMAELILGSGTTLEKLKSTFDFFYENFYSESEKFDGLTKQLTDSFSKLGLTLPKTREQFKELVVAAQKAGDVVLLRGLTDLQYAFADLVPLTEELTNTSNNYARSLIEAQRISAGAGAYTEADFLTKYLLPNYTASDMLNTPISLPALNATTVNTAMDNSYLIEAVNAVKDEIAELRYEVQADVIHNAKTATILTRVVPDGQSLNVTAAIDGGVV